jgi:hypothetical protein
LWKNLLNILDSLLFILFFLKLTDGLWSPLRPLLGHRTPFYLGHLTTHFFHNAKVKNAWWYTSSPRHTSRRDAWYTTTSILTFILFRDHPPRNSNHVIATDILTFSTWNASP